MVGPAQIETLLAAPDLLAAVVPGDLAVAQRLRERWPAALVAAATLQAELRLRAKAKFDRADRMLFTRAGLEQATSLAVAVHRAERLAAALGDMSTTTPAVLDLCCGIGGDSIALARIGLRVIAVDIDAGHVLMARHNAQVYDTDLAGAVSDVHSLRLGRDSVAHIDPARRAPHGSSASGSPGGVRGGYQPSLRWCTDLPAERICIKAAPGIDRSQVQPGWETEWVSQAGALKAAVLWSPALADAAGSGNARRASLLDRSGRLLATVVSHPERPTPPPPVGDPGPWVVDPDPAVTRAGCVADLASAIGGRLIDPQIAFVFSDSRPSTVLGRTLRVVGSMPWSVKAVGRELARLGAGDLQIRRRGLAGDVTDLRRRLLPRPLAGGHRVTLLLTRYRDKPWAVLTTDPARL